MKYTEKDIDKMSEGEVNTLLDNLLEKMTDREFRSFTYYRQNAHIDKFIEEMNGWNKRLRKDILKDYIDTLNS